MFRVKLPNQLASADTFATEEAAFEFARATRGEDDTSFILQTVRTLSLSDLLHDEDLISNFRVNSANYGVDEAFIEEAIGKTPAGELTALIRATLDEWAEFHKLTIDGYVVEGEERVEFN